MQHTEWIIQPASSGGEHIAVIIFTEGIDSFLHGLLSIFGERFNSGFEIFCKLLLGPSAYVGKFLCHGYIVEIIEIAEDTDLAESGDTRNEGKPYITVH